MKTSIARTAVRGLLFVLALAAPPAFAAEEAAATRLVPLMYDPSFTGLRIPPPAIAEARALGLVEAAATITINYLPPGPGSFGDTCTTWPAEASAAFTFAANIWASLISSPVPLVIDACWATNLSPGVLGHAGATTSFRDFAGAPQAGTWYPITLRNALAGTDGNGASAEIYAGFSSTFTWYFGTDGAAPFGTVDFVSVVLHEIGHGLGFSGSMSVNAGQGSWGLGSGFPFIYDRFNENLGGQSLINTGLFLNPSIPLATQLTSNNVFFNGTNANAANGGARVKLYAPGVFSGGSSISHLDEIFNGTPNALMTFSLSGNEAIHDPGPVTLGLLKDLGWTINAPSTPDVAVSQAANPSPAGTGKDIVFTITATNNGPGNATGVDIFLNLPAGTTFIWASPSCTPAGAPGNCALGTLASGASASVKYVVRPSAAGTVTNNVAVGLVETDPNNANNVSAANVTVNTSPAGVAALRYRLYSPVTLEHHFTTDLNEYNVLGGFVGTWVQEGTVGSVLNNPGQFNGVTAVPYYRLYDTSTRWHHWTTDANEYYTLGLFPWWNQEGVDGYILPTQPVGTVPLYRLLYPFVAGLHHWTIDANEYNALTTSFGWIGEGGSGFVIQ